MISRNFLKTEFTQGEQYGAKNAFSLVEVVLAIGVVSFALLGIFGLFTSSLKTNKDASAQQEGFEVQRMLLSKFQDTNFTTNGTLLSNMFKTNYVFSPAKTNIFFIYNSNNTTILTSSAASYKMTNGTLYYVQILQASNFPTNIFTKAGASYQNTDWPFWPALPVHAIVYAIPTTNSTTNATTLKNSAPVISFDFIIPK